MMSLFLAIWCYFFAYGLFPVATSSMEKAMLLERNQQYQDASKEYLRLIQLDSENFYAMQGAANCFIQMGDFLKASEYFEQASLVHPAEEFFMNAGMSRYQIGDLNAAMKNFKGCIRKNKRFRPCHIKLAMVYRDLGLFENVQKHLQYAIKLEPQTPDAYGYLGDTLNNRKFFKEALEIYNKGISLSPDDPTLYISRGDVFSNLKQYHSAYKSYNSAVVIFEDFKRQATVSDGKYEQGGIPQLEANAIIGKTFSALDVALWHQFERNLVLVFYHVFGALRQGVPSPLSPYRLLSIPAPRGLALRVASSWSVRAVEDERKLNLKPQAVADQSKAFDLSWFPTGAYDPNHTRPPTRPIRVGYLSRRFEDYPGTQMMLRLFSSHNRSRCTVFAFANGPDDGSVFRAVVRSHSDSFEDISTLTNAEGMLRVQQAHLDMLIDYDGIHDFNSLKLLAYGPSPRQVTWLGFPGTTGQRRPAVRRTALTKKTDAISTIIADKHVISPDVNMEGFSEQVVLFPGSYQPQDECQGDPEDCRQPGDQQEEALFPPLPSSRKALADDRRLFLEQQASKVFIGASKGVHHKDMMNITTSFWLICFNRMNKVTPDVFVDWMQILSRCRSSQPFLVEEQSSMYSAGSGGQSHSPCSLLLMGESAEARAHIQREAEYWGVPMSRILFMQRLSHPDYKRLLLLSDLFLDTRHYGAHTVMSDAIYGGLPTVSMPTYSFASRVAYSLNNVMDLQVELIAHSSKEYVDLVLKLVESTAVHSRIRRKVAESRGVCTFASLHFSRKLEYVYQSLIEGSNRSSHIFFGCTESNKLCSC